MSTSSPSSSSTICHQRALSLPQNSNLNASSHQNSQQQQHLQPKSSKVFAIQPVHHRTRSLPLTEENAIDFSASSPSNFGQFSQPSNNSMESIIEDYQNMDFTNNNNNNSSNSNRGGGSSILKHLSKIHASQNSSSSCSSATSPSQLRKKRQHIMTASLRSTYHTQTKTNPSI